MLLIKELNKKNTTANRKTVTQSVLPPNWFIKIYSSSIIYCNFLYLLLQTVNKVPIRGPLLDFYPSSLTVFGSNGMTY